MTSRLLTAFDEIGDLDVLLGDAFAEDAIAPAGVQMMRESFERRRSDLIEELLDQRERTPEHFDVVIGGALVTRRGVDVSLVGHLLGELQESVTSIATSIVRGPTRNTTSAVRGVSALRLSVALPGSLALRLVAADSTMAVRAQTLLGEQASVLEQSIARLIGLYTQAVETPDSLLGAVAEAGPRTAKHLRNLSKLLADSDADTRLVWRTPSDTKEVSVAAAVAGEVYTTLATAEETTVAVTLEGRMVGGSLRRNRFELELPDERAVVGSVPDEALTELERCFGKPCRATIVTTIMSAPGGGKREAHSLEGVVLL